MLIAATEVIDGFERMGAIDTVQGEAHTEWATLRRHKRAFTDPCAQHPAPMSGAWDTGQPD